MKAAFISKGVDTQSEGVRASVNLVVHAIDTSLFILNAPLSQVLLEDEEFAVWLEIFQEEMEAPVYTNIEENKTHGFIYLSETEIGAKLREYDVLIPF